VVLIGDIDRGGVIASLVGTFAVIAPEDAALVRATLVNKFRGDPALFAEGRAFIAARTGVPCLGPVPFFADAAKLPAEDSLVLDQASPVPTDGKFVVAVPRLPRIANFDDFDPLRAEPDVSVLIVEPGQPLPQSADLIVIPGSKATRADLAALRRAGWDIDIRAHARAGKAVIGICGGYQMLGRTIADPLGIEGEPGTSEGLGLLEVDTVLTAVKQLRPERARHLASGASISGYHMHMGETSGPDAGHPFAEVDGKPEGAVRGAIAGTYLHGIFASDPFRHAFLHERASPSLNYDAGVEAALDGLAAHLARHLDLDSLLALAAEV
jgi:adenosylcobyric acid synthase